MKQKNKKEGFLGTLGASLLGNILSGWGVNKKGWGINRAGEGNVRAGAGALAKRQGRGI